MNSLISSIFFVHHRLFKLRSHLRLQAAKTIAFPIDEPSNPRQGWVHFLDFAPHLLRDEPITRMALGHRSELAQMDGLAEIHLHVPASPVREGNNVLSFRGKVSIDLVIEIRSPRHTQVKVRLESRFLNFFRRIVTVYRGKILALLRQNSVAMNVAIGAQIADNVERIIDVLKRPPRLVPAVTPLAKVLFENLAAIILFDLSDDSA